MIGAIPPPIPAWFGWSRRRWERWRAGFWGALWTGGLVGLAVFIIWRGV